MKEKIFEEILSYALSRNDVAREGVDTKANEHLEEILGVSSTSKKTPFFEELKLHMIPREILEKMLRTQKIY